MCVYERDEGHIEKVTESKRNWLMERGGEREGRRSEGTRERAREREGGQRK